MVKRGLANVAKDREAKQVANNSPKKAKEGIASDAAEACTNRLAINRQRMIEALDARPDIWDDVTLMISEGYFDVPKDTEYENIIASTNKWHLLHGDKIKEILSEAGFEELTKYLNKNENLKLLCFLLHEETSSALQSKHWPALKASALKTIVDTGLSTRLKKLTIEDVVLDDGSIDYQLVGHFVLDGWDEGKKQYTQLVHASGDAVAIPAMYQVDDAWSLANNHLCIKTSLAKGFTNIPLAEMCSKQGIAFHVPRFAKEVGAAGRPKAHAKRVPAKKLLSELKKGRAGPSSNMKKGLSGESISGESEDFEKPELPLGDGRALLKTAS